MLKIKTKNGKSSIKGYGHKVDFCADAMLIAKIVGDIIRKEYGDTDWAKKLIELAQASIATESEEEMRRVAHEILDAE